MERIVVLGGGITGLCVAKELSEEYGGKVVVVEKKGYVGGLAATLVHDGMRYDLGSHRLHNHTSRDVLSYIEEALGEKLLVQPRKGRFYFLGRYIRYPPNMLSIMREFKAKDLVKFGISYLAAIASPKKKGENFEDVMMMRVGKEAYESFYRDYAVKLWGTDPKRISPDVGRRSRFLGGAQLFSQVLLRDKTTFFYPKDGIGEISEKLAEKIRENGGEILLNSEAVGISVKKGRVAEVEVKDGKGRKNKIKTSILISTIPIDDLYGMAYPKKPAPHLDWRGVRILFLHLTEDLGKEPETYYFPNSDVPFGRVSQIAKYSPNMIAPGKGMLLTIEVPSAEGERAWDESEEKLAKDCIENLLRVGVLDSKPKVKGHYSVKLPKSYPIYTIGWRENFMKMHSEITNLENAHIIGRAGLFLHCNIDHSVIQARKLAQHIIGGQTRESWAEQTESFLRFTARD